MAQGRSYSGKFVLRVGPELHARLCQEARTRNLSLNEYCVRMLRGEIVDARFVSLGLDQEFLESLIDAFPARPIAVVLFGSVARGEDTAASDIDLLIVFDRGVPITRSLYRGFDETVDISHFRYPANPHMVSLPESPGDCGSLWFEVALDGVVLWEDGSKVSRFLRSVRQFTSGGGITRKTAYGHPYWVKQRE